MSCDVAFQSSFVHISKCCLKGLHLVCCCKFVFSRYNEKTEKLEMSKAVFKKTELSFLGRLVITIAGKLGLLHVKDNLGEDKERIEINNMTLINLVIKFIGPVHESTLTVILMVVQVY